MPGEVVVSFGLQPETPTWQKLRSSSPFRKPPMSKEDIVAHGKCLCGQYIRARLRRSGYLNRKVTQRLRTLIDPATTLATRDIFPTLNAMGQELERMHPRVYTNVSRQLSRTPFGELADADAAPFLLHATAKEMFKVPGTSTTTTTTTNGSPTAAANLLSPTTTAAIPTTTNVTPSSSVAAAAAVDPLQITWPKIVSLMVVCAALAVDIVRQGHYDYLPRLLEGTGDIIDEDLAAWIQSKPLKRATSGGSNAAGGSSSDDGSVVASAGSFGGGGSWTGLVEYFRAPSSAADAGTGVADLVYTNWLSVAAGGLVAMYVVMFAAQLLGEWCWTCLVGSS